VEIVVVGYQKICFKPVNLDKMIAFSFYHLFIPMNVKSTNPAQISPAFAHKFIAKLVGTFPFFRIFSLKFTAFLNGDGTNKICLNIQVGWVF